MRGTEQTAHRRPKRAAVCVAVWLRISSQLVSLKIGLPGGPPARRQSREWCSPLGAEYSPSLPVQARDYESYSWNGMNAKGGVQGNERRVRSSVVVAGRAQRVFPKIGLRPMPGPMRKFA